MDGFYLAFAAVGAGIYFASLGRQRHASGPLLAVATTSKSLPLSWAEIIASMVLESSTASTLTFLFSLMMEFSLLFLTKFKHVLHC